MHNNDLITEGVGIVFGRLDAKHTFIVRNLSFRGAKETRKQRERGDGEAATEKSDTERKLKPAWVISAMNTHPNVCGGCTFCPWLRCGRAVTCPLYKTRHLLPSDRRQRETLPFFPERSDLGCVLINLCCFLWFCFQGFTLTFVRRRGILLYFFGIIVRLPGLSRALKEVKLFSLFSSTLKSI